MRIWFVDFGETSKQISRKINITNANWQFAQLYAFYVHFADTSKVCLSTT